GAGLLQSFSQDAAAAYVQDRIKPTSRLTIAIGLRYDMQINPQPQAAVAGERVPVGEPRIVGNQIDITYAPVPQGIPNDLNNWGPRTDFTYQSPHEQTIVKGPAGLHYRRTPVV